MAGRSNSEVFDFCLASKPSLTQKGLIPEALNDALLSFSDFNLGLPHSKGSQNDGYSQRFIGHLSISNYPARAAIDSLPIISP
jgi:hypothetical protein